MGSPSNYQMFVDISNKIDKLEETISERVEKVEDRVSGLERWKFYILGIAVGIGLVASYLKEEVFKKLGISSSV